LKKIILHTLLHKGQAQIAIRFDFDTSVKAHIKELDGVVWSQTHKTFYILKTSENKKKVYDHLRNHNYYIDYSALEEDISEKVVPLKNKNIVLSLQSQVYLDRYIGHLQGKRLSESTLKTYGNFMLLFLNFIDDIPMQAVGKAEVDNFMEKVIAARSYSISSHRQCVSALKYFAELFIESPLDVSQLKRPKKDYLLPTVLSKQEILALLQATRNLKHRAILALLYSSGLRIGELLAMELRDIDFDRRQVLIKKGKGRKDRNVLLAITMEPLLLNYIHTYKPNRYFVEGRGGTHYSATSIRHFLKRSCKDAGIRKRVTPHTLRHSYATHMLENGIDLRYIQVLLGHAKPETTMIYTHVTQKDLLKISSPLDMLVKELKVGNNVTNKVVLSRNLKW